jgi:hypothetical protein
MDTQMIYAATSISMAYIIYKSLFRKSDGLASIPTIGWNNPLLSYIDAYSFVKDGKQRLAEGYAKVCAVYTRACIY